jgi:hypothetical protein
VGFLNYLILYDIVPVEKPGREPHQQYCRQYLIINTSTIYTQTQSYTELLVLSSFTTRLCSIFLDGVAIYTANILYNFPGGIINVAPLINKLNKTPYSLE